MRNAIHYLLASLVLASSAFASGSVTVSSPGNNATVSSPFNLAASSSASRPIVGMKAYLDSATVASSTNGSLKASIGAGSGSHSLVVQAWDNAGAVYKQALIINVSSGGSPSPTPSGSTVKSQIQNMTGWQHCDVCAGIGGSGPTASLSLNQHQASPSLSGSSARFTIASTTSFADALWWRQLGADNAAKNFQYDLDFYITNPAVSQALEFDVNQGIGNLKFIFGTQCSIGGRVWDVWDTANAHWVSTGVACSPPTAFKWHHLTWELRRTATQTIFIAFTLDGVKHFVNKTFNARAQRSTQLDVAFQMDMNRTHTTYSVWLDNVKLAYW